MKLHAPPLPHTRNNRESVSRDCVGNALSRVIRAGNGLSLIGALLTFSLLFAAPNASLSDETRISIGYGTLDLDLRGIGDPIALDGKGYYLRAVGDEGDFLYSLSFGRHSAKGSGVVPPSPPEIPTAFDLDVDYPNIETVGATLGWHGLNLGKAWGFGPFIAYEKVSHTDGTFVWAFTDQVDTVTMEETVAGLLIRTEMERFDFSATAGSIIMGDAWEHGLAMSVAADIHVSDAVTLTGDWTRAWGNQPVWTGQNDDDGDPIFVFREYVADSFGLGGRVMVADGVFLEGGMTRARNGAYIDFGPDNWATHLNIGIGTSF